MPQSQNQLSEDMNISHKSERFALPDFNFASFSRQLDM